MKIGVGVSTYNRPDSLELCLESIRCFNKPEFDLFVADDGSSEKNLHDLKKACLVNCAELETGPRQGIAKNKNKILRHFKHCDFIFILEDDAFVRDPLWIIAHLEAQSVSGFHHFGHVLPNVMGHVLELPFGDIRILFTENI